MLLRSLIVGRVLIVSCLIHLIATPPRMFADVVQTQAREFDLNEVRLADGPFKIAQEADGKYMLSLGAAPADQHPIESTFSTVRLRTSKTKGAGSRVACLAMAFKLVESAQNHWRKLNGSTLLPQVIAGVIFKDGTKLAA